MYLAFSSRMFLLGPDFSWTTRMLERRSKVMIWPSNSSPKVVLIERKQPTANSSPSIPWLSLASCFWWFTSWCLVRQLVPPLAKDQPRSCEDCLLNEDKLVWGLHAWGMQVVTLSLHVGENRPTGLVLRVVAGKSAWARGLDTCWANLGLLWVKRKGPVGLDGFGPNKREMIQDENKSKT